MFSLKKVFILIFSIGIIFNTTALISTSSPECQLSALDLVFVVDQSGSIGEENFRQSMTTIADMIQKSLQIGQSISDSHVGMVLFNDNAKIDFYLNTYTSTSAVASVIENTPYEGGGTNIYLGMNTAIQQVFGNFGDRPSDPNVMLLITDGQDGNTEAIKHLNIEATQKNITIFAIGVGSNVNNNELLAAAGNASRVFNTPSYSNFQIILQQFCKQVQQNIPSPNKGPFDTQCSKNIKNLWVDMVFVLDSSKGVDKQGFNGIKGVIGGFVETGYTFGRTNGRYSRAGIVNMGTSPTIIGNLHKYNDKSQFMKDIIQMPYTSDDQPNIYGGLKMAEDIFNGATDNPNRRQVLYLFSSETNFDCNKGTRVPTLEDPCRLAAEMKEKGITIVTFALGYNGNKNVTLMKGIGSDCFNFFNDNSMLSDMVSSALYANCFCPPPLIQFKNDQDCIKTAECIYVHEAPTTWTAAQLICSLDGQNSTLANIFSDEKNEFLVNQLINYNSYPYMFGLNDIQNPGNFKWDSNKNLGSYTNWDTNEPNLKKGNCAKMNSKGKWYMSDCNNYIQASNYICEESACDADNFCP